MSAIFTCTHCGRATHRNVRLKKDLPQKYCSHSDCQNARRNEWRRHRRSQSAEYRERCAIHQKKWRQSYPADQYQKNYRESHPEYVERNRMLQGRRNRKCNPSVGSSASVIPALLLEFRSDGLWQLSQVDGAKIVKRYALDVPSNEDGTFALMGIFGSKDCKEIRVIGLRPVRQRITADWRDDAYLIVKRYAIGGESPDEYIYRGKNHLRHGNEYQNYSTGGI